jgi:hypothetical protein
LSKGIGQKPIQLMPAVISNILSEQAGADSQPYTVLHGNSLNPCFPENMKVL